MAGMEATMFTSWIFDHLDASGMTVKVAHPVMLHAIFAGKRKNDTLDARKLADLLRCNYFPECHMVSRELRDRRRALRYRSLVVRQTVRMKKRNARDGFGHANEVNSRQGNQQQRISQGVRSGQMTPGETRNVENRDASINREARAARAANGGHLTAGERSQINRRQNNVSRSIYYDKHNANNDAAAARHGRTAQRERRRAKHARNRHRPWR